MDYKPVEKDKEKVKKFSKSLKKQQIKVIEIFEAGKDVERAHKLENCGKRLEFTTDAETGKKKLRRAWFCKDRLCPACNWRHTMKINTEIQDMMTTELSEHPERRFLFLTLTIKNCTSSELQGKIELMMRAFSKLRERRKFQRAVVGLYRTLEVTYNAGSDTFHPHLHALIVVKNDNYFNKENHDYLDKNYLVEAWKECLGVDYDPSVDIRAIGKSKDTSEMAKAVCKAINYTVKNPDYVSSDISVQKQFEVAEILESALKGKRIVAFGGELKNIRKELKFNDEIS